MHATIEQLLELRDHRPVAVETLLHLEDCEPCRLRLRQLEGLREALRNLPPHVPEADSWSTIRARLDTARTLPATPSFRFGRHAAVAASLALIVSLSLALPFRLDKEPDPNVLPPAVAGTERPAMPALSGPAADPDPVADPEARLTELINHSARLEAALRALPGQPRVLRASTAETIMGLEDGVALIDDQLNRAAQQQSVAQSRLLWQRRVDLLNSLVNVRYTEVQPAAYTR